MRGGALGRRVGRGGDARMLGELGRAERGRERASGMRARLGSKAGRLARAWEKKGWAAGAGLLGQGESGAGPSAGPRGLGWKGSRLGCNRFWAGFLVLVFPFYSSFSNSNSNSNKSI